MNEQEQNNTKNKITQLASIDSIAEYALNALTEKSPSYFYECENAFTKEFGRMGNKKS